MQNLLFWFLCFCSIILFFLTVLLYVRSYLIGEDHLPDIAEISKANFEGNISKFVGIYFAVLLIWSASLAYRHFISLEKGENGIKKFKEIFAFILLFSSICIGVTVVVLIFYHCQNAIKNIFIAVFLFESLLQGIIFELLEFIERTKINPALTWINACTFIFTTIYIILRIIHSFSKISSKETTPNSIMLFLVLLLNVIKIPFFAASVYNITLFRNFSQLFRQQQKEKTN